MGKINAKPKTDERPLVFGNAKTDNISGGWFVGNFVDAALGLRHTSDVEIKWGLHKEGDERDKWVTGENRTAMAILISGKFELQFKNRSVVLTDPGDYVMWGKGTDHRWKVLKDALVITVRWPSIPN